MESLRTVVLCIWLLVRRKLVQLGEIAARYTLSQLLSVLRFAAPRPRSRSDSYAPEEPKAFA